MGSQCSCLSASYLQGDLEIVYEDTVLTLNTRPKTYRDLITAVLQVIPAARSEHDLVLEYSGPEEVCRIVDDLTLLEAYIKAGGMRAVIGVKLARFYVPLKIPTEV